MNYWGSNKKVKVESIEWEGPKARLVKAKWLNEVITHEIKIDTMGHTPHIENILMEDSQRHPNWDFETERYAFSMVCRIIAPRGELIEAGYINDARR